MNSEEERISNRSLPSPDLHGTNSELPPSYNDLRETLLQVKTIALEPGLWSKSRNSRGALERFYHKFSTIFPDVQNLPMVVNPAVPLADADVWDTIAGTPVHRCRLVKAAGDPDSVEVQSLEFVRAVQVLLDIMESPMPNSPVQVQNFEVYRHRQGRRQWEKYPL